jgi:hypothetical protein
VIAASVGIAAALVAYAASPGVRHAVSHAAHSVKHTVSNFFDHDRKSRAEHKAKAHKAQRAKAAHPKSGVRFPRDPWTASAVSSSAPAFGGRGSPWPAGDAPT